MSRAFVNRLPLLFAVALIASALGDPIVESIANTEIFGGHYADNNHIGIIPTLLVGSIVVLEVLALRLVAIWRRSRKRFQSGLIDVARDVAAGPFARDIPAVLVMQLGALFVLESVEQLVVGGKLLGGTAWLGGPILFSLLTHALVGAGCTFALGALVRAMARALISLVQTAIRFIWIAIADANRAGFVADRRDAPAARAQAPHVCQIGGRAPPLLHVFA